MKSANIKSPPALEQLGAMGSLLIHDMANQLCIISGNATFAQMTLSDPQSVRRAVDSIAKAGERLAFILAQLGELRRRLNNEMPRGEGAETVAGMRDFFAAQPGWTLDFKGDFEGELLVPTGWMMFAIDQVLEAIGEQAGQVLVRRVRSDEDTAFLPGGAYLQIRLTWNSPREFSMDDIRHRYERFGLMAAFELIRQCGGKLEGFTPAPGRQEILLCVPYLLDPPAS